MAFLSTAAAVLNRSSSLIVRRSIPSFSTLSSRYGTVNERIGRPMAIPPSPPTFHNARLFSSFPSADDGVTAPTNLPPPTNLSAEAGLAAQDAMRLFIEHGIGKRALESIAEETKQGNAPFIDRWQKMIHIYLQTQCAVIQLLGYAPDEHGITLYTQHLSQAMATSSPDVQEKLRTVSRDTYRMVLGGAFGLDLVNEQKHKGELSIVDARNMMHKVSLRMQDAEILEKVAKATSQPVGMNDSSEAKAIELAHKHTTIQKIMVYDVYLSESPSLVEECGFGGGEEGYVRMQSALADHQNDPLISQYVGGAMLKLLESAGIDIKNLQPPK